MDVEIIGDQMPYVARTPDVEVVFDRISEESRSGDMRAEVQITVTGINGGHVFAGKVNISGPVGRKQLQQNGESRYPFEQFQIDWGAVIEAACVGVIRRYREGEPVFRLDEVSNRESIRFRAAPYIIEGLPSLIYGEGGLGKSFMAVLLATVVQEGWPTAVCEDVEVGNVLYLDWESEAYEVLERAQSVARGLEMGLEDDRPQFYYRFMSGSLQNDRDRIQRLVADLGIDLVIVDSAGPACGGNPEAAEPTLNFFQALRTLRCSSLVIAHTAKGSDGKSGPFGSVYWWNMSRNIWEMRRNEPRAGVPMISVGLFHRKVNGLMLQRSRAITISWGRDAENREQVLIEQGAIKSGTDLAKGERLMDRIANAIRELGPSTPDSIWEALGSADSGTTLNTVRNYLSANRDQFTRLPNTKAYGLAATRYQEDLFDGSSV